MVDKVAQTYIDDASNVKKDVEEIEIDHNTDKLTGDLIIKDFLKVKKIVLKNHGLTSFSVENCPKLTIVNLSNNDDIKKVVVEKTVKDGDGKNDIVTVRISGDKKGFDELNLKNCVKLKTLVINDLGEIKSIKGARDFGNLLQQINMGGSITGLHLTTTEELNRLEGIEKVAEGILGGSISMKTEGGKQVVDNSKLKNDLEAKSSGNSLNSIGTASGLTGS